ncbi:patatin-like phospholipase family protein [Candidatus Bipolaricaulota bacterium]|nr:patatin-like phospholipase family protein [Candidatus Bipolaricaulota bacterium]
MPDRLRKLGVALSSGGPRGNAHIGVLKALEDAGIPVGAIAGASVGAWVGGCYAAGVPLDELARFWQELGWYGVGKHLLPGPVWRGWTSGKSLLRAIQGFVGEKRIEELEIPFVAVATDLRTGQAFWIERGPLAKAICASSAVPGLVVPVEWEGRLLIDGGTVDPLPVAAVRSLGAEVVLGVDVLVTPQEKDMRRPNVLSVLFQMATIFQKRILELESRLEAPDFLLRPEFGDHPPRYTDIGPAVEVGYRAAEAVLPALKEALEGG